MKLFEISGRKPEPQHCVDPDCEGEIVYDETNKDYECWTCGKSATGSRKKKKIEWRGGSERK